MTDLTQAIAEIRRVTPLNSPWEAGDIGVGSSPVDYHIAIILNAALSGEMIPLADHKLAVAEAFRRAGDIARIRSEQHANMALDGEPEQARLREAMEAAFTDIRWAILALADADALAEVQALRAERDDLRAAIFGSRDYWPDLRNGNFIEMAATLHAARKGALARAEAAEAELAATQAKLADAVGALHDAYNHQLAACAEWEEEMAKARGVEKHKSLAARYAGHYSAMNDLAKRIAALEGAKP